MQAVPKLPIILTLRHTVAKIFHDIFFYLLRPS